MSRPAAVSPDTIRTTVLAMLAEAGDPAPASDARFRKIVSVRKLRARLGAGDPAMLSRHLNAIEAECVQAGLTNVAIPDLPPQIADQMRALWQAAVAVQLEEVARLKRDTEARMEVADTARHEAELRTEMLRTELASLRDALAGREAELATERAERRVLAVREQDQLAAISGLQAEITSARAALDELTRRNGSELAAVHTRYEGLSRQLLRETAHQRDAWRSERERLTAQSAQLEERNRALEGRRDQLLTDLAAGREAYQQAAAEAAALATVVTEQRLTLQTLHAATSERGPARRPSRATRVRATPVETETAASVPETLGRAAGPTRRRARRGTT